MTESRCGNDCEKVEGLEAENKRYKEALEKMVSVKKCRCAYSIECSCHCQNIVKQALERNTELQEDPLRHY